MGLEYRVYGEWKKVSNLKMPFRIDQYKNGFLSCSIKLNSVEINKVISDLEFAP